MKKASTLKKALTTEFVYISALPVLIVGVIAIQILNYSMDQVIYTHHGIVTEAIAGEVARFLEEPSGIFKQFVIIHERLLISPQAAGDYLQAILEAYPYFDSLQLIDRRGVVIANAPYNREIIGNDHSSYQFVELFLLDKLPLSQLYWSSTFIAVETGHATLTLSHPFSTGMIIGQLNLSYLNTIARRISMGQTGYTAIFDRTGTVIAHPDMAKVAQQMNYRHLYPVQQGLNGHNGAYRFQESDQDWIGSTLRMPKTDWVIGIFQSMDEAFSAIYLIQKVIAVGSFIAVGLALLIAWGIVRKTMNPLSLLLRNTLKVKDGDYSGFNMPDSYQEINDLALHFSLMTEAIKAREHELRLSEAKFSGLIERLQEAVFRMTMPDGRYEYVSPAAKEVFGYPPGKFLSQPWFIRSLLPNPPDTCVNPCYEQILAGAIPNSCEYQIIDAAGQPRWIFQTNRGVFSPTGKLIALEGCCTDITVRKMAEQDLKAEKEFIEATINAVTDTIFVYEPTMRKAVRWNRAFAQASGYADAEIESLPAPDAYFSAPDLNNFLNIKQEVIKHGRGAIQADLITKNGQPIPMEYSASAIVDAQGVEKYVITVGRDITERKKLELQLQQARKMEAIGTIAGGIAHEFNNILSIIIGNAELAMDILPKHHSAHHNLNEIMIAGLRAKDAVYQLLGFTRKISFKKQAVDLRPLIVAAVENLQPTLSASIKLELALAEWLGTVLADKVQIERILSHLLSNAVQSMEKTGGILAIQAHHLDVAGQHPDDDVMIPPGTYVEIIIRDSGHGIDPVIQSRIFDPYFTTKEVGKGVGMGLPIVQGIVKSHEGRIMIDSVVGKGTTVCVLLPVFSGKAYDDLIHG